MDKNKNKTTKFNKVFKVIIIIFYHEKKENKNLLSNLHFDFINLYNANSECFKIKKKAKKKLSYTQFQESLTPALFFMVSYLQYLIKLNFFIVVFILTYYYYYT